MKEFASDLEEIAPEITPETDEIDEAPPKIDFQPARIELGEDVGRVQRLHLDVADSDKEDGGGGKIVANVSLEIFTSMFIEAFAIPERFLGPEWAPLAIEPDRRQVAQAVAADLYWLAEKFAPFLLKIPQADVLQRVLTVAGFFYMQAKIAAEIMRAKSEIQQPDHPEMESNAAYAGGGGLDYVKEGKK